MRKYPFSICCVLILSMWFFYQFSVVVEAKPTSKEYDKGYQKGYADAVAVYAEENANRARKDAIRQEQFIQQMKWMGRVIEKYNKATEHIQGL